MFLKIKITYINGYTYHIVKHIISIKRTATELSLKDFKYPHYLMNKAYFLAM